MWISRNKRQRTAAEVAQIIERFIDGTAGDWEWDDFISFELADDYLDEIRARCNRVSEEFPPTERGHYCNADGVAVLRSIARQLRGKSA